MWGSLGTCADQCGRVRTLAVASHSGVGDFFGAVALVWDMGSVENLLISNATAPNKLTKPE